MSNTNHTTKTILLWSFYLAKSFPDVATKMSLFLNNRTAYIESFGNRFIGNYNITDINLSFPGNKHCHITTDRSYQATSDAILFEHRAIVPGDLPRNRNPQQRWIIQSHEPPVHSHPRSGKDLSLHSPHVSTKSFK